MHVQSIQEQQSADTPTSTQTDQSRPASGLTFNEMPNEDTRYVTIETDSVDENETLLIWPYKHVY